MRDKIGIDLTSTSFNSRSETDCEEIDSRASMNSRVATSVPARALAWQVLAASPRFLSLQAPEGPFLVPPLFSRRRLVRQTRLIAAAHDSPGTPER